MRPRRITDEAAREVTIEVSKKGVRLPDVRVAAVDFSAPGDNRRNVGLYTAHARGFITALKPGMSSTGWSSGNLDEFQGQGHPGDKIVARYVPR